MRFQAQCPAAFGQFAESMLHDDSLTVVVGGRPGSNNRDTVLPAGIWIPLHGRLHLLGEDGAIGLSSDEMLIADSDQRLYVKGREPLLWTCVIGSRTIWQELMTGVVDPPVPDIGFMSGRYPADRSVRRAALNLVRVSLAPTSDEFENLAAASIFAAAVARVQTAFDSHIARCPGRTLAQRRSVFVRLQRVRNHMRANCHLELDLDNLARVASYSPGHFIRAFSAAFGKTPHAALVDFRLERALELIKGGNLAVIEVAVASGFENRCAFSRLFKQRFGVTAAAMRRSGAQQKAAA